ncbi:MAG: DUF5063 domain-containing protein [Bacteroides sp.]|nr:DUF5063 domain-containing protein [Bacteroides sp.]MCM1458268.1 DUF5063 domain-containing protein [Lachnoclostridium sp.]
MSVLTPNRLAFLALANEYCHAVENARQADRADFVADMLRLLPRIYIAASDIPRPDFQQDPAYIAPALDEDYYDSVRLSMEMLLGEDDTFLEVFEQDMKYSETPIAASISESLADIFQVLYNLIDSAKDAPAEIVVALLDACRDDFDEYWSQPLCNVLRALNAIRQN